MKIMNALTKSAPLALINLKDCREYMTVKLNNTDHQIKLAGTVDDPYFCGKDVCGVLGYMNIKQAITDRVKTKHKKDLQTFFKEDSPALATSLGSRNPQKLTYNEGKAVYINEPGLYSLIMHSKAPFAEAFQELVYEVILPSIRKFGSYQIEQQLTESIDKLALKDKELELEKERAEKAEFAAKISEARALTLENLSIAHRERLKNQIFYIVTTRAIAKDGEFKIGGFEPKGPIKLATRKRLAQYNTGASGVHLETHFYFVALFEVANYRQVEARVKELLAPFRSKRNTNTENFNLHFNILKPVIEMIVENYNEEIDKLNEFVKAILDTHTVEYINHVVPEAVDVENLPDEYNVVIVKRKFGEEVNEKIKMSDLNDEELKELLNAVVDEMVKNRTGPTIKRSDVEEILESTHELKSHKTRVWGFMKRIIESAGKKAKY